MSSNAPPGDDRMFEFQPEMTAADAGVAAPFTVLSVDDDPAFQHSLRLALSDFRFDDSPLQLLTASSAAEAEELLARTPDVSAILLDVVMETDDAGLRLVRSVREQLGNAEVRIVLVTGQPGMAPMRQTLQQLDISDYWLKTDLYRERLQGIVTGTLRTWREIRALGRTKRGLQQIVHAGRQLAGVHDLGEFSGHMLHELAQLLQVPADGMVCVRAEHRDAPLSSARVVSAAGRFTALCMQPLEAIADPAIRQALLDALQRQTSLEGADGQVLFFDGGGLAPQAAVYLATDRVLDGEEREVLRVFALHANAGLINVDLAARLDHVAYCDPLLDIPNGNALERELERVLAAPSARGCSLLAVDLGQYTHGSLALGAEQGDLLLQRMAGRLRQLYPPPCMVARLHEGTFAVLGPSAQLAADPVAALEQGEDDHALPFLGVDAARVDLDRYSGQARGVVAVALLLLRRARARGELAEYVPEGEAENRARFMESRALYRAVREHRIHIALQAQVSLEDGRIVGAEVLARWTEDGQPVPPARFIPIAEASGLIVPLGRLVTEQACQALQALAQAGFADIPVSVNVSPLQLRRREFVEELVQLLEQYGIEPRRLELEITEGVVMSDYQAGRNVLRRLRALGFPLAVDDFGMGYSSLRYVHSLPVTRLKLDRHFIASIDQGAVDGTVSEMIIALGRCLGLDVVAEGVETTAQATWLRQQGCPCAQGFLYARPEPLEDFLQRLRVQAGAA